MAERLERVDWLTEYLNTTPANAYYLISAGLLPEHCIVRLGPKQIRVDPDAVRQWVKAGGFEANAGSVEAVPK